MSTTRKDGFSLIEMLVILAIIALVSVLVVPAFTSTMMGSRLTAASDLVTGMITNARQSAIAHNRPVEVRFYRFGDPETPGENASKPETGKFRALQVFEFDRNGAAIPLTKVEWLPEGIIFDSHVSLSSIFDPQQTKIFAPPLDAAVSLPRGVGTNYVCMAFQFTPSGSTKFGFGNWHVTLHKSTDGDNLPAPPPNYAAVQIEAVSGAVKVYRP